MVEVDLTTMSVILGMAGIIAMFYFNSANEKRSRRQERKAQAEAEAKKKIDEDKERKLHETELGQKIDFSITRGIEGLSDKVNGKLEVIKVTTEGLEKRFDDWRVINRDEVLYIKQELRKLYDELDSLDKDGTEGSEAKISALKNKIELIEKRVIDIEFKMSHPYTSDPPHDVLSDNNGIPK